MAEKKFGVRDLEIIDPTGTPTIESSGDLIVNAGGATERVRITSSGAVQVANGNLVFSTSGTGIDFSATADGSGTTTSEILNDYEEGTFTPSISPSSGTITSAGTPSGRYVKIGRLVTVHFAITITTAGTANGAYLNFGNLPFTATNTWNQPGVCREQSVNGYLSTAQVTGNSTNGVILRYDNAGVIVSGGNYQCTITYEAQ